MELWILNGTFQEEGILHISWEPRMPDKCSHANMVIANTMAEIESAFYDIESIKNDIREIQYDLSSLDKKLHEITGRLREIQASLGQICPLPDSFPPREDPHKSVPL